MRSELFWDITQSLVVIPGQRFETTSVLYSRVTKSDKRDKKTLADGKERLFQNVGKVVLPSSV
jgi:hypothetical protein